MDTSPRTYRFLGADVVMAGYRVVGKIMVTSTGIIGILNDPTHSVLEMHDAHLASLDTPTKFIDHFELVRMMKPQVFAVCLPRREDLGPHALVRGGFSSVVEYPVHLGLQILQVEGVMELPGRFDLSAIMTDGSREFVPVYNASLKGILFPNLQMESGGMMINRRFIDLAALLNQRVKQQDSGALA